jgi:DNA-binding NarL/FixJ family response regulator
VKTVQNYVSRGLSHLQVTDRRQAALRASKGREI